MACSHESNDTTAFDIAFGFFLGLMGGVFVGILFAPKSGKETQRDVQDFVNRLPNEMDYQLSRSKVHYQNLVDKTRVGIENQLEQHSHRKQAARMAEAKRMEEIEAGSYDY